MATTDDIGVVNTLIATTLDSMKGYNEACEDGDGSHTQLFREMAQERSRVACDLQEHVRTLGGDPEDDSSTMGALHRGFMNLKELVVSRDEKAIINEVERGEDYLKAKYKAALDADSLEPTTRAAVERAYASVKTGHDKVSAIKHAMT